MHGYLPPFVRCLNANPYPSTSQGSVVAPLPATSSPLTSLTSGGDVEEIQEAIGHELNDAECSTKLTNLVNVECSTKSGDSIEDPKVDMVFTSEKEVFEYYKSYGKQYDFLVVTLRSKKTDDDILRYVTIDCVHDGKPRNWTENVRRSHPTSKIDCKAKITAACIERVWKVLTVNNTHNHDLNLKKSRFFSYNREVSESVKR